MKKMILLITSILLTSCEQTIMNPSTNDDNSIIQESQIPNKSDSNYIPLNYSHQKALWIPYTRFDEVLYEKKENEYRTFMDSFLSEAEMQGINTIYFHAHPNGDAYYISNIFPRGEFWNNEYDPLNIIIELAHKRGISIHAWINPLRMQTKDQMDDLPESFIMKKWTEEKDKGYIKLVGERWYLVPAYEEVFKLINLTADELLEKYEIDGIHIDDYFYPTTDPSFDTEAFEKSNISNLSTWRRSNITTMIQSLCETVHKQGNRYKFGISPQGNISTDKEKLYADVELWCSDTKYCDYIVPQIYYGFENEACPFEQTLQKWEELTENSNVSLIIGLAEYKVGKEDKWAGERGQNEWITSPDILDRQIEMVSLSNAKGYAVYR